MKKKTNDGNLKYIQNEKDISMMKKYKIFCYVLDPTPCRYEYENLDE